MTLTHPHGTVTGTDLFVAFLIDCTYQPLEDRADLEDVYLRSPLSYEFSLSSYAWLTFTDDDVCRPHYHCLEVRNPTKTSYTFISNSACTFTGNSDDPDIYPLDPTWSTVIVDVEYGEFVHGQELLFTFNSNDDTNYVFYFIVRVKNFVHAITINESFYLYSMELNDPSTYFSKIDGSNVIESSGTDRQLMTTSLQD